LIKGLRVTPQDVEASIDREFYFNAGSVVSGEDVPMELHMVTVCVILLKNGHKIVGVNEGPIEPENFDAELGRKMARAKATDQIWALLGYEKRTQWFERKRASAQ
jgi:hypothetical protein